MKMATNLDQSDSTVSPMTRNVSLKKYFKDQPPVLVETFKGFDCFRDGKQYKMPISIKFMLCAAGIFSFYFLFGILQERM